MKTKMMLVLLSLISFLPAARAADVEVSAGEPSQAVITVPAQASAGEPFAMKIEVRDRFGNVVTDYDRRGLAFELSVLGRGEIFPKTVAPQSFERGVAQVKVIYKIAERIEIAAKAVAARGIKIEARSAPFHVSPGKLSELRVIAPTSARAGTPFRVTFLTLDENANVIRDFSKRTDGVVLSTDGLGQLSPARVPSAAFVDGLAEVSMSYNATGEIEIRAKDPKSGVTGRTSGKISMGAGEPAKFQITAPPAASADESFDIGITAMDAFGNVVLDYDAIGTMVMLSADGSGTVTPGEILSKKFSKGVAFVNVKYNRPENIVLLAVEPGTSRSGSSSRIEIRPGRARTLELTAPDDAVAGNPFIVKIRALDARGNLTVAPTTPVQLVVVGSIGAPPLEIAPSLFSNGTAERKMTYNIAEEIMISAMTGGAAIKSEPLKIRVRSGPAASVEVSAPSAVAAGAGIPVALTALDAYRNVVTDFDRTPATVSVRVEGAEAPPAMEISSASFAQGKATLTLNYYRVGSARVAAEVDVAGAMGTRPKRTTTGMIDILPASLHHFDLLTPAQARAGEPFRVTMTARDAYGNIVTEYDRSGGGVQITSSGVGEIQPALVSPVTFKNGVAQAEFRSYAAEKITITASERFGSATGRSSPLKINSGPLSHFLISASPKVSAGEPFSLRIEAQDMYYNVVRDLTLPGRLRLLASGVGKVSPFEIDAGDFNDGIAVVQTTLSSAGATEITVETSDRANKGRSNPIQVVSANAAAFKVDVLDAVTAGEPFRVRVSAQDAYGNPVDDVRGIGRPIRLEVAAPGANTAVPSTLSPRLFTRGSAEAYLVYPQAGRVTLQVKPGAPAAMREDQSTWGSQVEGMFFKSSQDRTDIFVIASGPIEHRAAQPTQFGAGLNMLVVTIPDADAIRPYDYDLLNLPGLSAAKLVPDGNHASRLVLKIDSTYGFAITTRANMLQLTLRKGAPDQPVTLTLPPGSVVPEGSIPSLEEIQKMTDRGDYRGARRAVELFIAAHPGHPDAIAVRGRLEKVLRVLGE